MTNSVLQWRRVLCLTLTTAAGLVGCGSSSSTQPARILDQQTDLTPSNETVEDGSAVEMQGTLGTVSIEEVERVLDANLNSFLRCYEVFVDEIDAAEGSIDLALQIDAAGRAASVHVRREDLGSIEAEQCILNRIKQISFPHSASGTAHVQHPLGFEAPYDPPEPEAWSPAQVRDVIEAHRPEIQACQQGRKTITTITIYVGQGGKVVSSGAAAEAVEDFEAATCIARAARSWTFASPKAELAKITIAL